MAANVVAYHSIIKHVFEGVSAGDRGEISCRWSRLSFATVRSHVLVIEHLSEYSFEHRSEWTARERPPNMTIITREDPTELVLRPVAPRFDGRRPDVRRQPRTYRPHGAALPYRSPGVLMSRASHRRRPITPTTTVVLALTAAAITVWLGLVAQLSGPTTPDAPAAVPSTLAVVQ